jgi:hypothetical protein
VKTRDYGSLPPATPGANVWLTWEFGNSERVDRVVANSPRAAAELWAIVKFERLQDLGPDSTWFHLCVRDGDEVREFEVTIELQPRALVSEMGIRPKPVPAALPAIDQPEDGGAR